MLFLLFGIWWLSGGSTELSWVPVHINLLSTLRAPSAIWEIVNNMAAAGYAYDAGAGTVVTSQPGARFAFSIASQCIFHIILDNFLFALLMEANKVCLLQCNTPRLVLWTRSWVWENFNKQNRYFRYCSRDSNVCCGFWADASDYW